ncbi:MAG TPA: glycosyltransferase [Rhodanobacteraceae bacterium]|nr:glycosyltransferase [Rhodanobacteraceae bacterium]
MTVAAAHPLLRAPLTDIAWDGRVLDLAFTAGAADELEIALDLDGCHFATLVVRDDGHARVEFPFSPSGRHAVRLLPRRGRGGPVLADAPLRFAFGTPGLAPDDGAPAPLLPLVEAQRLLPIAGDRATREVVIVVPIHNAARQVERCLDALISHTGGRARALLIDDASPDPAVLPLLERYARVPGIRLLRNDRNRGFTATANRGMAAAADADVVLLNADTEVGPNWLAGLRRAAHARPDIGSATAVSDNAGAFSVPELERRNRLPACWSFAATSRALWQHAGLAYPELPTGNGFCLYLRRALLEAVGPFDEAAFPEGYGEENDLCQRASALGWRHVIAGNVLVAHARSSSFGDERRERLGRAGMAVLRERYPNYEAEVEATLHSFDRRVLDWRVRRIFADARDDNVPRPRLLWVGDAAPALPGFETWRLDEQHAELLPAGNGSDATRECARARKASSLPGQAYLQNVWNGLQACAIELVAIATPDTTGLAPLARALGIAVADVNAVADPAQACVRALAGARSFVGQTS